MRVIVATVGTPFVRGGAEALSEELVKALVAEGHEADLVSIPFNPREADRIPDQMLACRLLDLREVHAQRVDRVIALKFPAYMIPHRNKVVWLMHQHRAVYDLWDHPFGDLRGVPRGPMVRDIIQRADEGILLEARAVFTISENVTRRLRHYSGIESKPLYHPPPNFGAFYCANEVEDYFFFPSRFSATKRQELVIQALAATRSPVRVRFAGIADSAPFGERLLRLARKLGVEQRIDWLGFISDSEKVENYAHALAVLFPPLDEDYGYVTLEAMLASKAVITCEDSGGPREFVLPEKTGLVTAPTAEALAEAMDLLWQDRALAQRYGQQGRRHYDALNLSWSSVVRKLLA